MSAGTTWQSTVNAEPPAESTTHNHGPNALPPTPASRVEFHGLIYLARRLLANFGEQLH